MRSQRPHLQSVCQNMHTTNSGKSPVLPPPPSSLPRPPSSRHRGATVTHTEQQEHTYTCTHSGSPPHPPWVTTKKLFFLEVPLPPLTHITHSTQQPASPGRHKHSSRQHFSLLPVWNVFMWKQHLFLGYRLKMKTRVHILKCFVWSATQRRSVYRHRGRLRRSVNQMKLRMLKPFKNICGFLHLKPAACFGWCCHPKDKWLKKCLVGCVDEHPSAPEDQNWRF